ncbi:carboxypeptidase regulatory-like domain-containing protein [Pelomonas sp. Root1217]|uniref:carboxypeptidase regulatory-like domain-containing protein n=1 Tax=Pelomonas sp. Root1217 TaxID=1736430 RepID=UPI000B172FD0|nr:carboxypeptidase regulatory-like domain-containing protein [Pelomonas sp. Root1217]
MSVRKRLALLACLLALIGPAAQAAPTAEVTRGLNWLQGQVAVDGSVAGEATSVATSAQVRTEVARTLREIGGGSANLLSALTPNSEPSTEVASRAVLAAIPGDPIGATWVAALVARQLPDGSMPSFVDQGATDLDMAWALRALTSRPDAAAPLLLFLASRQQANGSWVTTPYSPLHVTALALCGLNSYASTNADAARAAASASAYVMAQRQADGSWSPAVWVNAQTYECLHDYLPNADDHASMRAWLMARQSADGSWGQDPFVTSLALRALALTAVPPLSPMQSGVSVRVVDGQTGAALSGVTVTLAGAANLFGSTDGAGSFQQAAIPPGNYQLTASYSGYTSISVALSLKAGAVTDVGAFRMSRTNAAEATKASVSGVAADASNGQPLSGVLVTIAAAGKTVLTDGQGRYSIDALAPGAYGISASKSGYSSVATTFNAIAGGSYVFSPRLPLVATGGDDSIGCRIYGKLLRATNGIPISGASITLSGVNSKVTASDATGTYVLPGLVSGNTTIRVTATGYDAVQATAMLSCVTPSATEFSPRLYPTATTPTDANTASLAFKVVDSTNGSALPGVAVVVTVTGQQTRNLTSAADGRVLIDNLPLASVQAQLSLAGYDGVTLGVTITGPQPSDIGAVPMKKSKSIVVTGVVTQAATRSALEGASVVLSGATSAQATTDSAGRFILAGLAAGTHTVTVNKAGFVGASSTFDAIPGGEYVVSPRLRTATGGADPVGCRLSGTVLAAQGGAPIAGTQITLTGANTQIATTDAMGAYSLDGLIGGNTRVVVSAGNFDSAMFDFRLGCSRPNSTDFSPKLYPAAQSPVNANTASVTFALLDAAKGTPLVAVPITATPEGQAASIVTTAANGRFTVTGLKQAVVQLQATVTGYEPLDLSFQVTPLQDTDMGELRLRPAGTTPLLPDLRVQSVSRAGAITDPQSLLLSGAVQTTVVNQGLAPTDRAVTLLAFEDRNRNGRYDAGVDVVLGRAAMQDALAVGASATVSVPVSGSLLFRDAPIHVWVDSAQTVVETDETNNVKSTADAAAIQPSLGALKPELKWHWKGSTSYPGSRQVESGILVVRTHDTNGDGRVDQADTPSVAFITYDLADWSTGSGVLRIVDGQTGQDRASIKSPGGVTLSGWPGFAAADVLHEGRPVFFIPTQDRQIAAVKVDGTLLWKSQIPASSYDGQPYGNGPSVADLNGNGHPVVLAGRHLLDAQTGQLLWAGAGSANGATVGMGAYDADLLGDGQRKVIVGASVYNADGSLLWQRTDLGDGPTAIADFTGDGHPRIVLSTGSSVYMLDRFGNTVWGPVSIPGGRGAPPVIADFDGDGVPDIGIAGASRYVTLRADGSVMWTAPIQDGSGQTGSTAFDFDGDGHAEIVYADEVKVHIYDGRTGTELFSLAHSNATAGEMPVVADIDNDGHADLLIANDTFYGGALEGVQAFRGTDNSWVNARPVWNQYAYSITNINDDLTIPANPVPSWVAHNTFRLNKRLDVSPNAVADATASSVRVSDGGSALQSTITVRVGNGGAAAMPSGVKVAYYAGTPGPGSILGVAATSVALAEGAYQDVTLQVSGSLAGYSSLTIVVDDDGTGKSAVTDFDRSNNALSVDIAALATTLSVSLTTDAPAYQANQSALFKATVANGGSFAKTARVRYLVQTADGQPVTTLPIGAALNIASGATKLDQATWNVGSTYAATYRVSADLLDSASDRVLASASASFTIQAGDLLGTTTLTAALQLDKGSYSPGDSLSLVGRVTNLASNQAWQGLVLQTSVRNPDGTARWNASATLDELAASGMREQSYSVPLSNAPAGTYEARVKVLDANGAQVAEAIKAFNVTSTASTGIGLTGHISVSPKPVYKGLAASFGFDVANHGNAALASLPLHVDIVSPESQQVIATMPFSVAALASGGSYSSNTTWTSNAAVGTNLVAVLNAQVAGRDIVLAQETFSVAEAPPKLSIGDVLVWPETKILVLVSCVQPAGQTAPCTTNRVAAIQSFIDSIGVFRGTSIHYKVVTTAAEFENEFHCGIYNAYWISGGTESLSDTLVKEVREAVRRGESLIVDGRQVARDTVLHPVIGVTQLSVRSGASQSVNLAAPFATSTLNASGPGINYALTTAQVSSKFSDGTMAIASNRFGSGQAWVFAFDLADTLIQSASNATVMDRLRVGMSYVAAIGTLGTASAPAFFTTGDVATLSTSVGNLETHQVVVEWRALLPIGTQFVSSAFAPVSVQQPTEQNSGQVVWRASVGVDNGKFFQFRVKVQATGGVTDVPVSTYSIASNGAAYLHEVKTGHIATMTGATLGANALTTVQALAPSASADIQARDRAVAAINAARSAQDATSALPQWIAAADELKSMPSANAQALSAAQLAVAWGAEAAADGICPMLATLQACFSGALNFASHSVPVGSDPAWNFTASNSCTSAFDVVAYQARLVNRRTGLLHFANGQTLPSFAASSSIQVPDTFRSPYPFLQGDYVDADLELIWKGIRLPLARDAILMTAP